MVISSWKVLTETVVSHWLAPRVPRKRKPLVRSEAAPEQLEVRTVLSAAKLSVAAFSNHHAQHSNAPRSDARHHHTQPPQSNASQNADPEVGREEVTELAKKKSPKPNNSNKHKPTKHSPTNSPHQPATKPGKSPGRGVTGSGQTLSQGNFTTLPLRDQDQPSNPWTPFGRLGDHAEVGQAIYDAYDWFSKLTEPMTLPGFVQDYLINSTSTGLGSSGANWDEYIDSNGNPTAAAWYMESNPLFQPQYPSNNALDDWFSSYLGSGSSATGLWSSDPYGGFDSDTWMNSYGGSTGGSQLGQSSSGSGYTGSGSGYSVYFDDNAPGK